MNRGRGLKGFALGAIVGSVCAGVTALLFAPKKGKQLRRDISRKYEEASMKAHELIEDAKEEGRDLLEQANAIICDAKEMASKLTDSAKRKRR